MPDIFDLLTPGRLIIRRANGQTYLDSADRTMVRLGKRSYNNIPISFPAMKSERFSSIKMKSGGLRRTWSVSAEALSFSKILGAIGTVDPDWMLVTANGKRTGAYEITYARYMSSMFPEQTWLPLNGGSLWVEQSRSSSAREAPFMQRILTVQPQAGNFAVVCKQSTRAYSSGEQPVRGNGTATAFTFSFVIEWGVFDL